MVPRAEPPVLQTIANGWWGEHWGPKLNSAWGPPGRWPTCCQQKSQQANGAKTTWQLLELCAKASAHKERPEVLPPFCSQTSRNFAAALCEHFISHPTHLIFPSQLIKGRLKLAIQWKNQCQIQTREISLSSEAAGDELIKAHPEGK